MQKFSANNMKKKKSKKGYFRKLKMENKLQIKKSFWKTVKPFLSKKVEYSDRINLTEETDSLITNCEEL